MTATPAATGLFGKHMGLNGAINSHDAMADCAAVVACLGEHAWIRTGLEMPWTPQHSLDSLQIYADAARTEGCRVLQHCSGVIGSLSSTGQSGHFPLKNDAAAAQWGQWAKACDAIVAPGGGRCEGPNEVDFYLNPVQAALYNIALVEALPGRAILGAVSAAIDPIPYWQSQLHSQPTLFDQAHGLAWHGYAGTDPPSKPDSWNKAYRARAQHAWLATIGHGALPIWETEFGPATKPLGTYTEADAATELQGYYTEFASQQAAGIKQGPWIQYCLRDRPGKDWSCASGVLRIDGSKKPAWDVAHARAMEAA